jgi:aerobic-type carbon monoxide dehydrogenase small subunit (CoxS/CutS family)
MRYFRRRDELAPSLRAAGGDCYVHVDGTRVECLSGQTLAAVLVAHGTWHFRRNPVVGDPRGPYCGMGVCFECEIEVDGVPDVRACMTHVREGMVIRTMATAGRTELE